MKGKYSSDRKYLYVSHHKCATQYTIAILRSVCQHLDLDYAVFDWREPIKRTHIMFNNFLLIQDYSHTIVDLPNIHAKGFHVIRDPRDLLVSMYFSHRDSHPTADPIKGPIEELARDQEILPTMSVADGLRFLMDESHFYQRVIDEMANWDYDDPKFYETTFEALTQDPQHIFSEVFSHLDIQLSEDTLKQILKTHSFSQLKKKWNHYMQTSTNHYRSGKSGDWREYLQDDLKVHFKQKYGDVVVKLGYARDMNW